MVGSGTLDLEIVWSAGLRLGLEEETFSQLSQDAGPVLACVTWCSQQLYEVGRELSYLHFLDETHGHSWYMVWLSLELSLHISGTLSPGTS